jgi:protein-tyrosine phosphatase
VEAVDAVEAVEAVEAPRERSSKNGAPPIIRPGTIAALDAIRPAARKAMGEDPSSAVSQLILDDMTDLHCHLVPGIEDGTANEADVLAALDRVHSAGVRHLVVTPHVRMSTARVAEPLGIARSFERLTGLTEGEFSGPRLLRGAEVMLDEMDPTVFRAPWTRLAGTRFVLVEFVRLWAPTQSAEMLRSILEEGYTPIVAHPERYQNASERQLMGWRDAGARLQVNCGSLLGHHGPGARDRGWDLLGAGAVDCLASNYRGRGAYPIPAVVELLESVDALPQAEALLRVNPSRILHDDDPLEVAPLAGSRSLIRRISRAVGLR